MDSDSLSASLVLLFSFAVFAAVHLADAAWNSLQRWRIKELLNSVTAEEPVPPSRFDSSLSYAVGTAKMAALTCGLLAGTALLLTFVPWRWALVALTAVGILALLGLTALSVRAVGERYAESLEKPATVFLQGLWWILRPLTLPAERLARRIKRIPPALSDEEDEEETSEETPATEAEEEGGLGERERRMIRAILQMEQVTVREIMVPRVDILAVPVETPIDKVIDLMVQGGHSRIPVYMDSMDNVVGILYARDLLSYLSQEENVANLRDVARDPYFVPESKRLDELLQEFQERRVHIALVVDEYGGIEGLVTIEDLLEEIVGEIRDEFEVGEPDVQLVSENEAMVNARVSLDQVNELFESNLSGEGFDTLGGFLYHQLGKVPSQGDEVVTDGLKLEVISTVGRRVRKVRVWKLTPSVTEG